MYNKKHINIKIQTYRFFCICGVLIKLHICIVDMLLLHVIPYKIIILILLIYNAYIVYYVEFIYVIKLPR